MENGLLYKETVTGVETNMIIATEKDKEMILSVDCPAHEKPKESEGFMH